MKDKKKTEEIDIKKLKEDLNLFKKERDEYLDGWKRAKADLQNFKKETAESATMLSESVKIDVVASFLPVLDALERSEDDIDGLKNVKNLFKKILKEIGVEEIEVKEGESFNFFFHDAVEGEGDKVKEVVQKGYKMVLSNGEKVIRPVRVMVKKT